MKYVDGKPIPNGEGVAKYDAGTYTGNFKMGAREGKGKFDTADGSNHFVGTFASDQYNEGTLTTSDNSNFKGSFKENTPFDGAWYDAKGSLICEVRNDKEI